MRTFVVAVVRSHNLSIGIVGLPNSGKSTLFNALTKSSVPAENYPFCTIDRNIGVIKLADDRLDRLAAFYAPPKVVPSAMTFVDIAGLVKGASKGEGLGNQFLGHIRETDAIMYVLRAFQSASVSHVYDRVNPVDDLLIVRSELILKDIETVEKRMTEMQSKSRVTQTDELILQIETLKSLMAHLNTSKPAYTFPRTDEMIGFLHDLWLLSDKPALYVLNEKGGIDEAQRAQWQAEVQEQISLSERGYVVSVDCKMEGEIADVTDDERQELTDMVADYHSVSDLLALAFQRLDLLTFYTGNEKEVNAWTIRKGATVKEAAGVIHTDLENSFVAAEVVSVDDLLAAGGWVQAKEKGLLKSVSKDYLVRDGDYVNILTQKARTSSARG